MFNLYSYKTHSHSNTKLIGNNQDISFIHTGMLYNFSLIILNLFFLSTVHFCEYRQIMIFMANNDFWCSCACFFDFF